MGRGASRPWDKGVVRSQKPIFRPFEPQFGLKVGGGGGGSAPGPRPKIRHGKQSIPCLCSLLTIFSCSLNYDRAFRTVTSWVEGQHLKLIHCVFIKTCYSLSVNYCIANFYDGRWFVKFFSFIEKFKSSDNAVSWDRWWQIPRGIDTGRGACGYIKTSRGLRGNCKYRIYINLLSYKTSKEQSISLSGAHGHYHKAFFYRSRIISFFISYLAKRAFELVFYSSTPL